MTNIIIPNTSSFDFNQLRLLPAMGIQGGAYFTKFEYNNKPLYIQTCKTYTKQGLVKSGKRNYCDLMLDATNEDIITWFEEFENKCYDLMYEKKDRWFQGSITKEDIENTFTPTLRVYKSGKYYLIRVNLKTNSSNELDFKIYDEGQNHLGKESFTNESKIISILEISGIKFTQQKFQIEIILKQSMIINDEIVFKECLINTNVAKVSNAISNTNTTNTTNTNTTNTTIDNNNEINYDIEDNDNNLDDLNDDIDNNDNNLDDLNDDIDNNDNNDYNDYNDNNDDEKEEVKVNNDILDNLSKNETISDIENLEEIDPFSNFNDDDDENNAPIKIKQPNEVYYEMYKKARLEAKEAKRKAQQAYLEAKQIKDNHLLDVIDSDSDSDSDINELSNY